MSPWRLAPAVQVLQAGGVIAYPTEGVFGLGCDPWNRRAVERILAMKRRSWTKGLILIAADIGQLEPFMAPISKAQRAQLLTSWPGPMTWVVSARAQTPRWLRGEHTSLAVRVTDHPVAAALCHRFGAPIVSTSANRAGRPPACSARQVRRALGAEIDWVVDGPVGGLIGPTPIRDLLTGTLLRSAA
jgi:L-threonylcarbamoyladenylate synthase